MVVLTEINGEAEGGKSLVQGTLRSSQEAMLRGPLGVWVWSSVVLG